VSYPLVTVAVWLAVLAIVTIVCVSIMWVTP